MVESGGLWLVRGIAGLKFPGGAVLTRAFPKAAATSRHLLSSHPPGLDTFAGLEEAMKLSQPRERMPLTVWIALMVFTLASVAYIAGVFLFDYFFAFF